ncbi:hypothetical protein Tco_0988672 [Tanacetum coccineum]|uniref:Uncharacterized protein n=1 Tax=Tanacetum coccineum TaxID=301880 RepID=A0ABQ5ES28_9ASTR
MVEEVTSLKKDFKQKENKYLEEFLDMKALKEKVEDKLFKQDQSLQTVHMLCKPKPYYDEQRKVAIGYKNPLCLTHAKQVQPALYNEVIPFFKTLKEYFEGIQKALTKEMKETFEELEAEVDHNVVNRKYDEIERKNLLIENDNLIADCFSKEVFYIVTNSELNVSRFTEMHDAHTVVQARILELKAELSKLNDKIQKDDHTELIKHFSNLKVCYIDVSWPYDGSIDDLEVFGLRLEVDLGTVSRSWIIIGVFYLVDFSFDLLLTVIKAKDLELGTRRKLRLRMNFVKTLIIMANLPPLNNDPNVLEDEHAPAPEHAPIVPNPAPIQPNDYLADDDENPKEEPKEEKEPIPKQALVSPVGFAPQWIGWHDPNNNNGWLIEDDDEEEEIEAEDDEEEEEEEEV